MVAANSLRPAHTHTPPALCCPAAPRVPMPEQNPVLTPSQLNTLARDLLSRLGFTLAE